MIPDVDSTKFSDDELDEWIDSLARELPDLFSDLFGIKFAKTKKLRKPVLEKLRNKMKTIVVQASHIQETLEQQARPGSKPSERLFSVDQLLEFTSKLAGIPPGTSAFDYYERWSNSTINTPSYWGFLKRSDYKLFRDKLNEISEKLYNENRLQAAAKLLEEFNISPDGTLVVQFAHMRLENYLNFLRVKRRKLEKRQIVKLFDIYREASGIYEKLIRVFVGLMKILDGIEISYQTLLGLKFSKSLRTVEKSYPLITRDYDSTIRNAIAHPPVLFRMSKGTLEFRDSRKTVPLTYQGFFQSCRDLLALVLALLQMENHVTRWRMRKYHDLYSVLQKEART